MSLQAFTVIVTEKVGRKFVPSHFSACIKHDSKGWYYYNDNFVKPITEQEMLEWKPAAYYCLYVNDKNQYTSKAHGNNNKLTSVHLGPDSPPSKQEKQEFPV